LLSGIRGYVAPILILLAGAILSFFHFSATEAGASNPGEVWLSSGLVTARIDGKVVDEKGIMLAADTKRDWVVHQGCADKLSLNEESTQPLKNDVLMLDVDNKRVCLYKDEAVKTEGGLYFRSVDLEEFKQDNGSYLVHNKDSNGIATPVVFREVRYWVEPSIGEGFMSWLGPALVALAIGIFSTDLHARWAKGKSQTSPRTPQSSTSIQGHAGDEGRGSEGAQS
jgi:hypothetical protein